MYHAPGVAHFAKITIILSRRGTLELLVSFESNFDNPFNQKSLQSCGKIDAQVSPLFLFLIQHEMHVGP